VLESYEPYEKISLAAFGQKADVDCMKQMT